MKFSPALLAFLFLLTPLWGSAQSNSKSFFDKDWKRTLDSANAEYYRIVQPQNDGFLVRDYFKSDTLEMEAFCKRLTPKMEFHGSAVWYHPNGKVKKEGTYTEGKPSGRFTEYYENGGLRSKIFHEGDEIKYEQFWSETGTEILSNGSGLVEPAVTGGTTTLEIVDSKLFSAYEIRAQEGDTIYMTAETQAEYKGGHPKLSRDLQSLLTYPRSARKQGIEGTVFVMFVVDKKGKIAEPKVIKGISQACDEEAARVVSQLGEWVPAMHKNKIVKTRFVLPIKFQLTG